MGERATALLSDILDFECEDGATRLVSPWTLRLSSMGDSYEDFRTKILSDIEVDEDDLGPLIDSLIAVNQQPYMLTFPSSPERGYTINYSELENKESVKYQASAHKPGEITEEYIAVSLPVYDPRSKVLLIYIVKSGEGDARRVGVAAFKYEGDKLIELGWASL